MTYKIVQPRGNGVFYLYEGTSVWDPEKKQSRQKRVYVGRCDEDGNLLEKSRRGRKIERSPVYGPYHLFTKLAEKHGLRDMLRRVYGDEDGDRLLALAVLGVVDPCTVRMMESEIEDTYLRELLGIDWSFEQSGVRRFIQRCGRDTGRRHRLFEAMAPRSGVVFFDIVCIGTDSGSLEYAEAGRRARFTGSRQFNLGLIHSKEDGLPFCYRTYPGSVADVSTLRNVVGDLRRMGCGPVELEMDRGFFSVGNVELMRDAGLGFTVPVPSRYGIEKLLISESVGRIESPLNTDTLGGCTVRGYDTHVRIEDGRLVKASGDDPGAFRAVVVQDDQTRTREISTLYRRISDLESKAASTRYDPLFETKLSKHERGIAGMLEFSEGEDGTVRTERRRKAVSARENACGRFVILTTSEKTWREVLIQYRKRNDAEYDFSQIQSDLRHGINGGSDQDSAEGGLLVNFLSLRLRLTLINDLKDTDLAGRMWVPDILSALGKLKISKVGGEWRLNEVTRTQRTIYEKLGIEPPDSP